MLAKDSESPAPALEPWLRGLTQTSVSQTTPSGISQTSSAQSSMTSELTSTQLSTSGLSSVLSTSQGLSLGMLGRSQGLLTTATDLSSTISTESRQIKHELSETESSHLVSELLAKSSYTSTPVKVEQSSPVQCKRTTSEMKSQSFSHPRAFAEKVKEEHPDLCDMVGVDKTTYLEFLNNPILPSISEVEQLLLQCETTPCRNQDSVQLGEFVTSPEHPTPIESPTDIYYGDEETWNPDYTTLQPAHDIPHDLTRDIKTEVPWSEISNHGYDSSGSAESPRSTVSLESEETEFHTDCRLPMAVENMDDVIMTSHMEDSQRLSYNDDDFGTFEIDEEKAYKKRRKGLHLWEFLLEVLDDERYVPHLLYWVERQKGIFKIEKSQEVAKLWGRRKQRSHMTYEHMSRAMRHYYSSGIMRRIPGKRLMYQFGPRAFATSKS